MDTGADARRCRLVLVAVFVASRLLAAIAGVRFDAGGFDAGYIHFVDRDLLRADLVGSLWHLHMQPPLFNAYLGAVVHLPSSVEVPVFALTYWALGLLLVLALAELLVELGVPRPWSCVVAAVFTCSPAVLLYEHWLFVTYPTAAVLTAATAALARWARTSSTIAGAVAFGGYAVVALLRPTFHLVWLVAVVAVVLLARPVAMRRTMALALPAVLLVAVAYGKNAAVDGTAGMNMWQGMNLSLLTTMRVPIDEREALVAAGTLSPYALRFPFQSLDAYEDLVDVGSDTGVAVLDRRTKVDGSGAVPNFNHPAYLEVDARYLDDALELARGHPGLVASGIRQSATYFFTSAADYATLAGNRRHLGWWYGLYLTAAEGRLGTREPAAPGLPSSRPGVLLMATYAAAAVAAAAGIVRVLRRRAGPRALVLAVIGVTLAVHGAASLLVGSAENNRFRFEVEPLVLAAAAAGIAEGGRRWIRPWVADRRAGGSRTPSSWRRRPSPG